MPLHAPRSACCLALLCLSATAQAADGLDALPFSLLGGAPNIDLRARWEHVDNEAPANPSDSNAITLRTRLGYTTGKWNGIDLNVEMENVAAAADSAYNSTLNGVTRRPAIADPTGTTLNQFWIRYNGLPGTVAQLGRNRIVLDNQRWIGNSGWRQNEQTYDSLLLKNTSLKNVEATYAYLTNVSTFLGTNIPMYGHALNVGWTVIPQLKLSPYFYRFNFKTNSLGRADTRTLGLRATGALALTEAYKLTYTGEYARQKGIEEAPGFVKGDYYLGELGVAHKLAQAKLGYEVLGSNAGLYGVQTPLATLHAHDGWADIFLNTPKVGLTDAYLTVTGTSYGTALTATAHKFNADSGSTSLGRELDLQASYPVTKQFSVLAKYARYKAGALLVPTSASATARVSDTEKLWLQTEFKF